MRRTDFLLISATAFSLALISAPALAQQNDPEFSASIEIGGEYDSNVGVIELDQSTDEGDYAALVDAELGLEWKPANRLTLKGGYDFSGKAYAERSDFNQQVHRAFADASWDFDIVETGISYNHAIALLDGEEFLTLQQTSFYAGRLFADRYYVRAAADRREKQFEGQPDRDASANIIGADAFVFFNKARSFVTLGVATETEDADVDAFDYEGLKLKARVTNKFELAGLSSRFSVGGRYEDRDYEAITPLIDAVREDERKSVELGLDTALTEALSLTGKYEYADYSSNLPSADYSENTASVGVKLSF